MIERNNQLTSTRARTRRLLLDTAVRMFNQGIFPSITDVATTAQVSRATAYRYFPTQSALVSAVIDESLGPVLAWNPTQPDAKQRVAELLQFAYPRMLEHEGALRAALLLSLQQWADRRSNRPHNEKLERGNRKRLLKIATEPLEGKIPAESRQRVIHALSLVYGSEVFLVLKDIWDLDDDAIQDVTQWVAKAILRQAEEEASISGN
ncbi:TetR family transcriptional regulator [Brenneria goodwinii]|uniref:TetR family transcriptional regulator n=2 Tax=Brenneria goodwinii TaxID=1109412 RepID=A0AAE8EP79_9GAMM|nr:TetR/AcrR family transcriptional regulator [Brenneria goodwinii]ATA25097.1 TetR family transcriptional regulator [Brenneria goodwinii]MCG8155435.1 TetR/AcrR family transcriptional regulator [Brenneria goodwinii]MCG8161635.1 TetR/AcrR family transcriptional regulator [Brenneria goodwinii]MCG8166018.1 TetR/AcrR family transcriptional regulator [Brenneria goodwinii]MCG8169282.1 TetR/AcrR family transcriptional regulator [Brenneria goodwinii]